MKITFTTKKSKCKHDITNLSTTGYVYFDIGYCPICKNFVIQVGDNESWEVIERDKTTINEKIV